MSANISTDAIYPMPREVTDACRKIAMYMEVNGHHYWCVDGVCDRRWAYLNEDKLAQSKSISMFEDKEIQIKMEENEKFF